MFGLTFEKLLLIGLLAVIIVGPDRLPRYAASLARFVKWLRSFADGARTRMREEMGPEFDEVDWKKLDPRQYDPRRIIREALTEDEPPPRQVVRPARRPAAGSRATGGTGSPGAAAGPEATPPAAASTGSPAAADAPGAAHPRATPYDAEAT